MSMRNRVALAVPPGCGACLHEFCNRLQQEIILKKNARAQRFAWLPAIAMIMALAGCQKAAETNVEAPVVPASADKATVVKPELPPLFRYIGRRTVHFCWDTTNAVSYTHRDGYKRQA